MAAFDFVGITTPLQQTLPPLKMLSRVRLLVPFSQEADWLSHVLESYVPAMA